MVPSPPAVYFPALDKCFNGEQPLLSWEAASRAFNLLDHEPSPTALDNFLRDESAVSILSNPLTPFTPPSSQTKSDFETRTAAIHVLPSNDGQYDIKQIKEDALWLSKEAGINELAALRIVILEWQNKAAAQLLAEWSEEERLSVQSVTANASFRASTQAFADPHALTAKSIFDKEEQRHARLLNILYTEENSVLALSASLIGFDLSQDYQPTLLTQVPRVALKAVAKAVWHAQKPDPDAKSPRRFFVQCCDALNFRMTLLSDPSNWPKTVSENPDLATIYAKSVLSQIIFILRLAFLHTFNFDGISSSQSITAWFELMDEFMFFSELPTTSDAADALVVIQCLVALISVGLIKTREALGFLVSEATNDVSYPQLSDPSYWEDDQAIRLITNTLLGAVIKGIRHAGLAILAWSIVAQGLRDVALSIRAERQIEDSSDIEASPTVTRPSSSKGPPSKLEKWLDLIMDIIPTDDPIAIMGNSAVNDLQAFDTMTSISEALLLTFSTPSDIHISICAKTTLFAILREGYSLFQYGPDLVQALLSATSYDTVPPTLSHTRLRNPAKPVKALMADTDGMGARFLDQAVQRYPYELRPCLKTLLSISQSRASLAGDESEVLTILENMTAFTQRLPPGFDDYDLVREDEMPNCIQLTQDLPIFLPRGFKGRGLLLTSGGDSSNSPKLLSSIPAGTIGIVVSEQRPFVVCWQFQHSGLEYLGALLSTRLPNASFVDATSQQPIDKETASEIIALADSLIYTAISVDNVNAAKHVIGRLSHALLRNDDIVRVIFEIFEGELQAQIDQPAAEGSLYLLVHCARFLQSVLSVHPERIWSLLARSKLLSVSDSTGALAAIVTATELPLGQYDFLRCCIGLYEGLIDDSIKRSVSRKTTSKAVTRFEERNSSAASTPQKLMSATLAAFQRIMLDVLQSSPSWKFTFASERCEINTRILNAMTSILYHAYGVDDNAVVASKLTGVHAQAADVVLEAFLAENPHELTFHPILTVFMSAIADLDSISANSTERLIRDQITAALTFCTTVLDVGLLVNRKGDYLANNILQTMPLIARLFAARHSFKSHVATLMTTVVRSLHTTEGEPASLLGHLGSDAMKCFLAVIAELDLPLQDVDTETAIWNMLSAVVSHKQQWLAVCLLTGSTPRDKLKERKGDPSFTKVRKPLFGQALDQLANIKMLSPKRAIAILTFIARSQDHWSWASNGIAKHSEVINSITDWIADLTPNIRTSDMESMTRAANENQMAALIVDILARYLHNARQLADTTTAKTVATKLQYLRDNGVAVDGFNHSLHQNLSKNFSARFPECPLSSFKRTAVRPAEFGREYYYDRHIAGKVLDFDAAWGRRTGFFDEFARANVNLSLVESQVNLLKSWKALAIGLGQFAAGDPTLQTDLAVVATNCLKANMEISVPAVLFDNIAQLRADLAFVLLQRLTLINSKEPQVRKVLSAAWDTVRTCSEDFETASTPRDVGYYRTILRVLFLSIQPQIYDPVQLEKSVAGKKSGLSSPPIIPTLLEILERVVTVNFRALCSAVHADDTSTEPADYVLLTALLQSILRVPGMSNAHASVAAIFANAGTARYAASLYSWADQLAAASATGDPVYGELSILFLLELSSVPLLAEQMAVDGLLSRISSANLSQYLRKPTGKGPFDEPARMFSIWSRGMLPLCLNLLEAVGPPIASEIGAFLNSFPEQLKRAETDLENRQPTLRQPFSGNITLGMAAETHSLSLISLILERLKSVGAAAGINADEVPSLLYDRVGVKEEVETLVKGRRALRERIVPVGEREADWVKQRPGIESGDSRLEESIVSELGAALVCLTG
ncbi:nucleoporin subcomplex protein binding to Pom34-domain-containing protein [Delphinella strobiligena]|nr:nucleoporin subcomplex protein binding to Pom34-domain-containing protein [Delphinella strobiligena]